MRTKLLLLLLFPLSLPANSDGGHPKRPPSQWHESDYVNFNCDGKIEHVLSDRTRVDCLSETHAIEYDWGKKWAEAIGQSLYYSAMTGKKAGIVLIVNPRTKDRYLKRLNKVIEAHNLEIDIWTIDKN